MSITINPKYLMEFNPEYYISLLQDKPLDKWEKGNLRRIKIASDMMEILGIGNRVIEFSNIINFNNEHAPSIRKNLSDKGKIIISYNISKQDLDISYNLIDSFIIDEFKLSLVEPIKSLIESGKSGFIPFYYDADACKKYIAHQNNIEGQITNLFSGDSSVSLEKLESNSNTDIVKVIKFSKQRV